MKSLKRRGDCLSKAAPREKSHLVVSAKANRTANERLLLLQASLLRKALVAAQYRPVTFLPPRTVR
jgi:hypothetical protein